MKMIRAEGASI